MTVGCSWFILAVRSDQCCKYCLWNSPRLISFTFVTVGRAKWSANAWNGQQEKMITILFIVDLSPGFSRRSMPSTSLVAFSLLRRSADVTSRKRGNQLYFWSTFSCTSPSNTDIAGWWGSKSSLLQVSIFLPILCAPNCSTWPSECLLETYLPWYCFLWNRLSYLSIVCETNPDVCFWVCNSRFI